MDKCKMNACGNTRNVLIGVMNMYIQLYVHVVMLLAENPNDLQGTLDRLYESVKGMDLKFINQMPSYLCLRKRSE